MKHKFLVMVLAISLCAACSTQTEKQSESVGAYTDYIGIDMRVAVEAGDVYGDLAKSVFKTEKVTEYASSELMIGALIAGEVDAVLISHGFAEQFINDGEFPDYTYLLIPEDVFVNKAASVFHTEELRGRYNEWFAELTADGTFDEIKNRWLSGSLPEAGNIPKFDFTGENGVLRVCDTGNYPPLSYYNENSELVGFDAEMASRFAFHLGMDLEIIVMDYEKITQFVASGQADMSACTFAIDARRGAEDNLYFGEPSVITRAALIVRKDGGHE